MPANRIDKVIITNVSALRHKYDQQLQAVQDAVDGLIAADQKRGLMTQLVAIDDAKTMQRFSGARVSTPSDPAQNKAAIDAVYEALAPDYLMILGSTDVVPHQDLKNPVFGKRTRTRSLSETCRMRPKLRTVNDRKTS